jgi:hypothetical protein
VLSVAVVLFGSWGSFLAGEQPGDREQERVQVLASAEVAGQGPPVGQVPDAVPDAEPHRRVSRAFGTMRRDDGEQGRRLILPPGRAQ